MSIEAMKQALECLERVLSHGSAVQMAKDVLRQAIEQAESVQPVAWVYPEGIEALKTGKPWTAYGFDGNGPNPDGVERIPLYLNDAVAPRVEPRASESGAGFESLPASPNAEQSQPVACKHEWFSTGAMEPGQMRCIHCGKWGDEVDAAPPQRQPVAWLYPGSETEAKHVCLDEDIFEEQKSNCIPLYTAPPPRQPLTDEQCDSIAFALDDWALNADSYDYGLPIHNEGQLEKARAIIRAALNIKGES
jgi:hypothetical protein